MPEILIRIDKKTSKVKIEGEGFNGLSCVEALDKLTDKIGFKTVSRKPKIELLRRNVKIGGSL